MSFDATEKSAYGASPVELYEFTCGTTTWRSTSSDQDFYWAGHGTFYAEVISRGEVDNSDEDTQGSIEVSVLANHAVAVLFTPKLPAHPVMLTLYRLHRTDVDAEIIQSWQGEIASVTFSGSTAKLTGIPVSRVFRRPIPPNTFQSQCNWVLFSPQCGLAKATYKVTATLAAVGTHTITATAFGAHADGYFNGGWVEDAAGETHWIVGHVGNVLTLMTSFGSIAVGASVYAYPGCNRTIAACAVFGNLQHHCGFSLTPNTNPFVAGINQ